MWLALLTHYSPTELVASFYFYFSVSHPSLSLSLLSFFLIHMIHSLVHVFYASLPSGTGWTVVGGIPTPLVYFYIGHSPRQNERPSEGHWLKSLIDDHKEKEKGAMGCMCVWRINHLQGNFQASFWFGKPGIGGRKKRKSSEHIVVTGLGCKEEQGWIP